MEQFHGNAMGFNGAAMALPWAFMDLHGTSMVLSWHCHGTAMGHGEPMAVP